MLATVPLGKDGLPLFKEEEEDSDEDDLWDVDGDMTAEQVTAALTEEKRRKKVRWCAVRYIQNKGQRRVFGRQKILAIELAHILYPYLSTAVPSHASLPACMCQRVMCFHILNAPENRCCVSHE